MTFIQYPRQADMSCGLPPDIRHFIGIELPKRTLDHARSFVLTFGERNKAYRYHEYTTTLDQPNDTRRMLGVLGLYAVGHHTECLGLSVREEKLAGENNRWQTDPSTLPLVVHIPRHGTATTTSPELPEVTLSRFTATVRQIMGLEPVLPPEQPHK